MALEKKSNDWKEFLELESAEVPETPFVVKRIVKRDGSIEKYDRYKIASAIGRAVSAVQGMEDKDLTDRLTEKTEEKLRQFMSGRHPNSAPAVEEIQDLVEEVMMENVPKIAKAYILYRAQHEALRDSQKMLLNNTLDAAVLTEPYATQAKSKRECKRKLLAWRTYSPQLRYNHSQLLA